MSLRHSVALTSRSFLVGLLLLVGFSAASHAQQGRRTRPPVKPPADTTPIGIDCVGGCIPDYGVEVTPDSSATTVATSGTWTRDFTVKNKGNLPDTWDLSCGASGLLSCISLSQSTVSLDTYNETATITVTFSAASAGLSTLSFIAEGGHSTDNGSYKVTINGPGAPVISTAPQNASYRDVSKCVASCFDGIYQYSTPSYVSLGAARSFSLTYNSSTHKPRPIVWVDVSENAQTTGSPPTNYSIKIKNLSTGTFITQLNGSTITYYTRNASGATRVAAVFDAQANSITTGRTSIEVTLTSYYSGGPTLVSTATTYVVVNDRSGTVYGAGVSLSGYQRLKIQADGYAISEGDGSVVFYTALGKGNTPLGSTAWLTYNAGTSTYTRTYLDASYLEFNSAGRMTKSSDRFGNATTYTYYAAPNDSLISTITDPMGKAIQLCYNGGCSTPANAKLHHVNVLFGGGVISRASSFTYDGSGRLIRALDPDSYSDSLAYGSNGILSQVFNRARQVSDIAYDSMYHVQTILLPSILLFDGTNGRPIVTYVPSERAVWQPSITGVSLGTAKAGIKGDSSLKSLVIGNYSDTTRYAQDKFGAPTKITDPFGATSVVTRDGHSRPTRVDEPSGRYSTATYNYRDQVISTTDGPSGRTINYTYRDTLSTDVATISGDVVRQDFTYYTGADGGPAGALKRVFLGNTATWPTIQNAQIIAYHRPDSRGRDTTVLDSLGHGSHLQFEATWGNLWKSTDPSGLVTTLTYDGAGRNDSTIAPLVGKSYVTYGTMNQVLTQVSPGYKVTNSYDPATLALIRVQTPRPGGTSTPVVYRFSYNALGMITARNDAKDTLRADTLKYDLAGNVRTVRTRHWNQALVAYDSIIMTYDRVGRLRTRAGSGLPTDYFRYDSLAGLWSQDSNSVSFNIDSLDVRGRLKKWLQVIDGRTYTGIVKYDSLDRVTRRSLLWGPSPADSSVNSFYYNVTTSNVDMVCPFSNGGCLAFTRNGDMQPTTRTFNPNTGNSWPITRTFDANHRILSEDYGSGASAKDSFDISFGYYADRVTSRIPHNQLAIRRFTYDSLGRLIDACDAVGANPCHNVVDWQVGVNAWSYDSTGNRAQVGTSSTYGTANRILTFGTTGFSYDSLGSIVCRIVGTCPGTGTGYKYSFDALGRLRGIRNGTGNPGALIDSMFYDARGRRVRKIMASGTESYIYQGDQVILDVDSATGNIKREYAWYPGTLDQMLAMRTTSPADTFAVAIDPRLGTVRGLLRFRTGALVKDYAELPWGDVAADTGISIRYRFAGREFDQESGLYYMRARYYDPTLGRFISEDPAGTDGGLNLYAYAGDDPVNNTDPSGKGFICWRQRTVVYSTDLSGNIIPNSTTYGDWYTKCEYVPDADLPTGYQASNFMTTSNKIMNPFSTREGRQLVEEMNKIPDNQTPTNQCIARGDEALNNSFLYADQRFMNHVLGGMFQDLDAAEGATAVAGYVAEQTPQGFGATALGAASKGLGAVSVVHSGLKFGYRTGIRIACGLDPSAY